MDIIWTILIGFVVGLLAKMLTPGRDPSGFFVTAVIGIAVVTFAQQLAETHSDLARRVKRDDAAVQIRD